MEASRPADEDRRIEALRALQVLDTPPEAAFDDITRIAAQITGATTALVTLVDEERQWFKSVHEFPVRETSRDVSFCAHAILQPHEVLVVDDAMLDERFRDNPLVTGDPRIRFYAGAPLTDAAGLAVGTLCVIDYAPRGLRDDQREALQALSRQVMKELQLRRNLRDMAATITGRRRAATPEMLQALLDRMPAVVFIKDTENRFVLVNAEFEKLAGVSGDDLVGHRGNPLLPRDLSAESQRLDAEVLKTLTPVSVDVTLAGDDGAERIYSADKFPLLDWAGRAYAVVTVARDITDRLRYEQQLEHLADHDALTGLASRRRFMRDLEVRIAEARRDGVSGAVVVLDIDGLRAINDVSGHRAGDLFLLALAEQLQAVLRESDLLARLAGDQFGVLLRRADAAALDHAGERLLAAARACAVHVDGRVARATVSGGACLFTGRGTAEDVLTWAEDALDEAKDRGRDQLYVAQVGTAKSPRSRERATVLDQLRDAIDAGAFELHAQPVVELGSGEPAFHELLVRMRDERGELLLPAVFLPAAERFDLVQRIDRWVALRAVALLAQARARGVDVRFSVNVSAKSLRDTTLFDAVRSALDAEGVEPGRLLVEVTETTALANMAAASRAARDLQAFGCRFALDDFGAGFGSFYYLKHLPLDTVKIDGDFVRPLAGSRLDQLVVESVVRVSRELGCRTVAEYVTHETVDLLRDLGVDCGQGFDLGRPEPVERLLGD